MIKHDIENQMRFFSRYILEYADYCSTVTEKKGSISFPCSYEGFFWNGHVVLNKDANWEAIKRENPHPHRVFKTDDRTVYTNYD